MKTLGAFFGVIVGIGLLGVLATSSYRALKFSLGLLADIDSQVATMTAIAAIVILLAAMIIARSIRQASHQNKTNQLRAEQAATYNLLIDLWGGLLQPGRDATERNPNPLSAELPALDRLLAFYGSPAVIQSHVTLRTLLRESGAQSRQVQSQFAKTLLEIRKDLGTETHGLSEEMLQQLLFANTEKGHSAPRTNVYQDRQPRISLAANT